MCMNKLTLTEFLYHCDYILYRILAQVMRYVVLKVEYELIYCLASLNSEYPQCLGHWVIMIEVGIIHCATFLSH